MYSVSFGTSSLQTFRNVTSHHEVVDRRRKHITKEDGEHHTLRIAGIHHTDDDGHRTDEEAVDILTRRRATRGHRVGSHKHGTEGEATHDEVLPPGNSLATNGKALKADQKRFTGQHAPAVKYLRKASFR